MKLALTHRIRPAHVTALCARECYASARKCFDAGLRKEAARYFAYAEIYEAAATAPKVTG